MKCGFESLWGVNGLVLTALILGKAICIEQAGADIYLL